MGIPISEIVASFKEKNCILLLGPGLAIDKARHCCPGPITISREAVSSEEDIDNLYSEEKSTRA